MTCPVRFAAGATTLPKPRVCGQRIERAPICRQCWALTSPRFAALLAGATGQRTILELTIVAQAELGRGCTRAEVVARMAHEVSLWTDHQLVLRLRQLAQQLGSQHPLLQRWRDAWRQSGRRYSQTAVQEAAGGDRTGDGPEQPVRPGLATEPASPLEALAKLSLGTGNKPGFTSGGGP